MDKQPIRPVAVVAPVPPARSQPSQPPPAERAPAERVAAERPAVPPVESRCGEFSRNMRNDYPI
jgi:hypothetical protein